MAGFPPIPSGTVLERRRWVREHADHVRRTAVFEPRGHRDMYAAVLLPPDRPDADVTVLFMHNEGYSTMCGHGTIAIGTALVEEGLFPASVPETLIRLEAPAGLLAVHVATRRTEAGAVEVTWRALRQRALLPRRPGPARAARWDRAGRGTGTWTSASAAPTTASSAADGAGPARGARADRGADPRRGRDHRAAAPRPHARRIRSNPTWASCTARSSSTAPPRPPPIAAPPTQRSAT